MRKQWIPIVAGITALVCIPAFADKGTIRSNVSPSEIKLSPVQWQTLKAMNNIAAANPSNAPQSSWQNKSAALKPGVYTTKPFACIVIVPGDQADQPMAVPPLNSDPSMPIVKPDLRFLPFEAK